MYPYICPSKAVRAISMLLLCPTTIIYDKNSVKIESQMMSRLLVGVINQVKFIESMKDNILTISIFLHIRALHILRISVTRKSNLYMWSSNISLSWGNE